MLLSISCLLFWVVPWTTALPQPAAGNTVGNQNHITTQQSPAHPPDSSPKMRSTAPAPAGLPPPKDTTPQSTGASTKPLASTPGNLLSQSTIQKPSTGSPRTPANDILPAAKSPVSKLSTGVNAPGSSPHAGKPREPLVTDSKIVLPSSPSTSSSKIRQSKAGEPVTPSSSKTHDTLGRDTQPPRSKGSFAGVSTKASANPVGSLSSKSAKTGELAGPSGPKTLPFTQSTAAKPSIKGSSNAAADAALKAQEKGVPKTSTSQPGTSSQRGQQGSRTSTQKLAAVDPNASSKSAKGLSSKASTTLTLPKSGSSAPTDQKLQKEAASPPKTPAVSGQKPTNPVSGLTPKPVTNPASKKGSTPAGSPDFTSQKSQKPATPGVSGQRTQAALPNPKDNSKSSKGPDLFRASKSTAGTSGSGPASGSTRSASSGTSTASKQKDGATGVKTKDGIDNKDIKGAKSPASGPSTTGEEQRRATAREADLDRKQKDLDTQQKTLIQQDGKLRNDLKITQDRLYDANLRLKAEDKKLDDIKALTTQQSQELKDLQARFNAGEKLNTRDLNTYNYLSAQQSSYVNNILSKANLNPDQRYNFNQFVGNTNSRSAFDAAQQQQFQQLFSGSGLNPEQFNTLTRFAQDGTLYNVQQGLGGNIYNDYNSFVALNRRFYDTLNPDQQAAYSTLENQEVQLLSRQSQIAQSVTPDNYNNQYSAYQTLQNDIARINRDAVAIMPGFQQPNNIPFPSQDQLSGTFNSYNSGSIVDQTSAYSANTGPASISTSYDPSSFNTGIATTRANVGTNGQDLLQDCQRLILDLQMLSRAANFDRAAFDQRVVQIRDTLTQNQQNGDRRGDALLLDLALFDNATNQQISTGLQALANDLVQIFG